MLLPLIVTGTGDQCDALLIHHCAVAGSGPPDAKSICTRASSWKKHPEKEKLSAPKGWTRLAGSASVGSKNWRPSSLHRPPAVTALNVTLPPVGDFPGML